VGLLTGLILLPLAPLRGTIRLAEFLAEQAEEQMNDERALRGLLVEAEAALDRGEMTEAEYDHLEDQLLDRIDALRVEVGA
jgi:gas vesicle protein GvpG